MRRVCVLHMLMAQNAQQARQQRSSTVGSVDCRCCAAAVFERNVMRSGSGVLMLRGCHGAQIARPRVRARMLQLRRRLYSGPHASDIRRERAVRPCRLTLERVYAAVRCENAFLAAARRGRGRGMRGGGRQREGLVQKWGRGGVVVYVRKPLVRSNACCENEEKRTRAARGVRGVGRR